MLYHFAAYQYFSFYLPYSTNESEEDQWYHQFYQFVILVLTCYFVYFELR